MTLEYVSLNWVELAKKIKATKPKMVYGFVKGMEETGGCLYANGKIVEYKHRPNPWMYATYNCGKEVRVKITHAKGTVEEYTCETLEVPWKLGEYWPEVAKKILEN